MNLHKKEEDVYYTLLHYMISKKRGNPTNFILVSTSSLAQIIDHKGWPICTRSRADGHLAWQDWTRVQPNTLGLLAPQLRSFWYIKLSLVFQTFFFNFAKKDMNSNPSNWKETVRTYTAHAYQAVLRLSFKVNAFCRLEKHSTWACNLSAIFNRPARSFRCSEDTLRHQERRRNQKLWSWRSGATCCRAATRRRPPKNKEQNGVRTSFHMWNE